jgi:hypothetical protein
MFVLSLEGPRRGAATLVDPGRAVAPLALLYDLETGRPLTDLRVRWGSRLLDSHVEGHSTESGLGALSVNEVPTTLPVWRPSCRLRLGERVRLTTPRREALGTIVALDPVPQIEPYERRFGIRTDIPGGDDAIGSPLIDDRGRLLGVCLQIGPVVASPSEWLAVGGPRYRLREAIRSGTWKDACDLVEELLREEDTHDPELLAAAGQILEQLDQREGACAYYAAAARDDPGNAWTRYRAGCCLADLGQRTDAQRWLEQAIRLEPWNIEYRRAFRHAGGGGTH